MQSSRLVHTEGSGSTGALSADAGAAGVLRHRVAAGEAAGIENGNRGSETAAYESRSDPGSAIECGLKELMPLELEIVAEGEAVEEWKERMDRYHELGYRHPFGCFLRYWLRDRRGRQLGCLLFEAGTTRLPCRDAWMGWRDRAKRLKGVVNNSRFLIFPWVQVPYLASKDLSMAVRRLPGDWKERHGLEPVLVETFVDPAKYRGTCYRAANWQCIGRTKGRKANASEAGRSPKDVYLYPLTKDWKQVLLTGSRRSGRCSRRSPATVFALEDTLVRLWSGIVETLVGVAHRHDRLWQRWRRVLSTLVVVLFVFRLVFSKGRPGYATTLAELWGQCRTMGDRTATAGSGVAVLHLQCPGQAGRAAVQDLALGNPQGGLRRRRPTPARTESPSRHGPAVAGASGVCVRWNLPAEPAARTGT